MTKRQLVKWLEKKQDESLNEVENQYNKALAIHKQQMDIDLNVYQVSKEIAGYLDNADKLMKKFTDDCEKKGVLIERGYYRQLNSVLSEYSTETNVADSIHNLMHDKTDHMKQLKSRKENMKSEIYKNYKNVIAVVQSLKDAKSGVKYLQELGFDLTELIEQDSHPVTTALSVEVDKRYLFIGIKKGE